MMRRLAVGVLVLLLGACAQIPTAEFGQYQKAFAEVEQTSTDILVNYDQTLERARLIVATRQKPAEGTEVVNPYPIEFDEFLKQLGSQNGHDIDVRRQALQVVARYNAVLTQLAQGKSVDDVQTTAGELVTALGQFVEAAAGSAVPGFPAIVSLAKTFAGQLEKARLQREFKKAVVDGAPVVDQILDQFIADAADHYKLNAGMAQEQRILIVENAVKQVRSLKLLVAGVGPPSANFPSLDDRQNAVNIALVAVRGELAPFGYPYAFASGPPGSPAYTAAVDGEAQLIQKEIERLAGLYQKNLDQVRALGEALAKYATMLQTTKTALATLRQAVDKPVNLVDVANQLLDLSFGIERDLADLRAAIAASS
jgi:hypothetical protein